jgi:hypothetical protein
MGALQGLLPRRRITPSPVLGDFMACAKTSSSSASVVPRDLEQRCKASSSSDVRAQRLGTMAIVAAASSSLDQTDGFRDGG